MLIPVITNFFIHTKTIPSKKWNFNMSMASFFQMIVFSLILFFPVGEWLRPIVETYRTYDIRFSLRGDLEGWTQLQEHLIDEQVIVPNSLGETIAIVGSNFRISSQMAWAARVRNPYHVYSGGPAQNQFAIWKDQSLAKPSEISSTLLIADNRYPPKPRQSEFCRDPIRWNTYEYFQGGFPIKNVFWYLCKNPIKEELL
jgi:hypothetical protein